MAAFRCGFAGAVVASVLTTLVTAPTAAAEPPEVAARRAAERTEFSDEEIADGFFKIAFGAEMHTSGRVDRIRKYDVPVRVYVDNRAKPDRRAEVAEVVADIRSRVAGLDIAVTAERNAANVVVRLVRDRDMARTIRQLYGRDRGRRIVHSLEPQCLSGFRKDDAYRILRSDVILAVDVGEFVFRDCVFEELLQALGPINDDPTVPWSMFNDDVQMGFFDRYDQILLNVLYDPRIRPGMTRDEVRRLLPQVLSSAREFVTSRNRSAP